MELPVEGGRTRDMSCSINSPVYVPKNSSTVDLTSLVSVSKSSSLVFPTAAAGGSGKKSKTETIIETDDFIDRQCDNSPLDEENDIDDHSNEQISSFLSIVTSQGLLLVSHHKHFSYVYPLSLKFCSVLHCNCSVLSCFVMFCFELN